jgi:hypothetical protein
VLRRKVRFAILGVALVMGFAVPSAANGVVRKGHLTSPIRVGDVAALAVDVSPRARCTILLQDGIAVPTARGLSPRTGMHITWRWRVRKTAPGGPSAAIVSCGKSGTLRMRLTVVADPVVSLADAVASICGRAPRAVVARFGTMLVLVPEPPTNGCKFRVDLRAAPDFLAYYTLLVVPSPEPCGFAVSTHLSVVRSTTLARYPGPFDEYYTVTCRSLA